MRNFIWPFLTLLAFSSVSPAQELKIGFVQVDDLMQSFPDYAATRQTYQKEVEDWKAQMDEYQKLLAEMEEDFQQKGMLYSPEKRQEKQDAYLNKKQEAAKFYEDYFGQEGKAKQREQELLQPIYDKMNQAIQTLAQRDGYALILNGQGLLFGKKELDVTAAVLEILKSGTPK